MGIFPRLFLPMPQLLYVSPRPRTQHAPPPHTCNPKPPMNPKSVTPMTTSRRVPFTRRTDPHPANRRTSPSKPCHKKSAYFPLEMDPKSRHNPRVPLSITRSRQGKTHQAIPHTSPARIQTGLLARCRSRKTTPQRSQRTRVGNCSGVSSHCR